MIQFQRIDPDLPLPSRSFPGDAGIDLSAANSMWLEPGERGLFDAGFAVAVPDGHVGILASRSGMGLKQGVTLANSVGIIDAGYRGEIKVALINLGQYPYRVGRGHRIAQLIIMPVDLAQPTEVDELPESHRGTRGFGSTGTTS